MKQSFLLKNNWIGIFDKLSDKQAGVLIKMLFEYNVNGDVKAGISDDVVNAYFNMMILDCIHFKESYDRRSETSAKNGKLGGRPKNEKPNKPNSKPKKPNNLSKPVIEIEIENENENENDLKEKTLKRKKEDLKIREEKFYKECAEYVGQYPKDMIREFYDYWTEQNKSGTKMRFELQNTWALNLRIAKWANNNFNK